MNESPRRFCQITVALCCAAFTAIAVLNYVVNPYAQYATQVVPPMVQPSRSTKLDLIGQMQPRPNGLVLGSSRVLKLEPAYLNQQTGLRFFNAGVNYGKPEDFLAFLRLYIERFQAAPEMVVLGLDVVALSDGTPTDARLLGNPHLASQVTDIIPFEDRFHRWKELLSWQQTTMSAKSLLHNVKGGNSDEPLIESFQNDGLIVYHKREQELADGTYDFASALDYNCGEYKQLYHGFGKLSSKRCEAFNKIAAICRESDTRLVVFLTPMHPGLQEYLNGTVYEQRRTAVHAFVKDSATSHQFAYVNLSSVANFEGAPDLFVDGIHPLEPNTRKIVDHCLAAHPNQDAETTTTVSHVIQ